jgi:ABC-2 type transport system ATP-binding protein
MWARGFAASMSDPVIVAQGVQKSFGKVHALRGVDLTVERGRILGLLGPNGAGKTTLVRILTTLLRPSAGRATVAGFDVERDAAELRRVIGLAGQSAAVDENLTGRENIAFIGRLNHMPKADAERVATELLARFDLTEAADRPAKTYSGGMRRRLDLAASLVSDPDVIFLDEPTTGLDPRSRLALWSIIEELRADGKTVLLTTQYLEEADRLADRIAVVDHGVIIAEGTASELKTKVGGDVVEVALADADGLERAQAALRDWGATADAARLRVSLPATQGSATLADVIRKLDAAKVAMQDVQLRRPTLDDVFLALTGKKAEAEEASA